MKLVYIVMLENDGMKWAGEVYADKEEAQAKALEMNSPADARVRQTAWVVTRYLNAKNAE